MTKNIVHRVEEGMDPRHVLCTTYQMRNFYRQLADGYFTALDVFNYIQHHQIVRWCKKGDHVLDVCCGRGLLLPMLRYHRKDLGSYTGVDIEPKNARFFKQRVTDGKPLEKNGYYPFPLTFVEANVAEMASTITDRFNVIVYTSAIEHMHKDAGLASLGECRKLAAPGSLLVLTCPRTPEDQDGYDTQYRAHVYEWKLSELKDALATTGWNLVTTYGLHATISDIRVAAEEVGVEWLVDLLGQFVPREWLGPVLAPAFPGVCKEVGLLCRPGKEV
jgi:SAM-dependent methyltransferase